MTTTIDSREPALLEPYWIYFTPPTCPNCGSLTLGVYKTYPIENDGSQTRRAKCKDCGRRVRLIAEPE